MLARLWWFIAGVVTGGAVVIRALGKPRSEDLRDAAVTTGADLLDLTARVVRPKRTG